MPEVEYTTTMQRPIDDVWNFVQDMDNWAPFMTGYQEHEKLNDQESIWTLKGDVGVLARTVKLKANITEWSGPERVEFTLDGLNEPVTGGGVLVMAPFDGNANESAATRAAATGPGRVTSGGGSNWLSRLFASFFRILFGWLFRMKHGTVKRAPAATTRSGPGSRLTFTLRMEAGGPTGPLVNAMLAPVMLPAAEDLANKIAAHLEDPANG